MILDGEKLDAMIERYVNGPKALRNRAILRAYYLEGCTSYEEAAERCGVSPATVSRVVHKHGDPLLIMLLKN